MYKEHETVIFTDTVKGDEDTILLTGDAGCTIHIHGDGDA